MPSKPIAAYQLLQNCDNVPSFLFTKVAEQEQLKKIILSSLPFFLHIHYSGCAVKSKTLVVFMDSPVWSSPVRFHTPEILARFRKSGISKFNSLMVRTHYDPQNDPACSGKIGKTKIPSRSTISQIRKHSQSVTDPQLASSLLRLASTLEQRNQITSSDIPQLAACTGLK